MSGNEFITAGGLSEYLSQEYDENEIVSYSVYGKSDVESDLGCEITDEQWKDFIREWESDDVLNEIRAQSWMLCIDNLRQELGIDE
jgi:hypothetical protein